MKLNSALYYGDFVAAPIAIVAASTVALSGQTMADTALWAAAVLAGVGLWTFIEYAVHAWVYHRLPWFDEAHAAHHDEPKALLGAPSFLIVGGLLALAYAPYPLFAFAPNAFGGAAFCGGIASGLLAGYLGYMTIHHMSHHAKPGGLLATARLRHLAHHYRGGASNFGVTTLFWDRVFSTTAAPERRNPFNAV
jgi:sterol desaturase/sphingolipid hydroxylase (fatty acid hydroxylase superfamily)